MKNHILEAYVTNLGKYNEGCLIGEWVSFPTTSEYMKGVLERIGINDQYQEIFMTDYSSDIYGLSSELGEYERYEKLNYLAGAIQDLDIGDREKYEAILKGGLSLNQNGIDGLINLTYNLDNYGVYPEVHDDYDLGEYYLTLSYGEDLTQKFGEIGNYIDFEAYGRDARINGGGMYTDAGYVLHNGGNWDRYYDGSLEDIPHEYQLNDGNEKTIDNQFNAAIEEAMQAAELPEQEIEMEI